MKDKCIMCNTTNTDGCYSIQGQTVCKDCGKKYSLEEIKKMITKMNSKPINEERLGNNTFTDKDEAEYYRNKELYANSGLARHREAMEKAKQACKEKGIEVDETQGVYESKQLKENITNDGRTKGKTTLEEDKFFNLYQSFNNLYGINKMNPNELIEFINDLKKMNRISDKDFNVMNDYANKWQDLINKTGYESNIVNESKEVKTEDEPLNLQPDNTEIKQPKDLIGKYVKIGVNYYPVFDVKSEGDKFVICCGSAGPMVKGGEFEPATIDQIKNLQLYVDTNKKVQESKTLTESDNSDVDVDTDPIIYMNTWKNYNEYGADLTMYGDIEGWMTVEDARNFAEEHEEDEPFINDINVDLPFEVNEYSNVMDALDNIEEYLNLDEDDRNIIDCIMEVQTGDINEALAILRKSDYMSLPDVSNEYDLGYEYVQDLGFPTNIMTYFDEDKYKEDIAEDVLDIYLEDQGLEDVEDEDDFEQYVESTVNDILTNIENNPDNYRDTIEQYFDYEYFGRDLTMSGWSICEDKNMAIYIN